MRASPKLTFGKPDNGWLPISYGDHRIHASDVPCDSLRDLISRLIVFLSGSKMESMEWSLEPEYEKWIFQEEDKIVSWIIQDETGELVCALHSSRLNITRTITNALRELYSSYFDCEKKRDQDWSWGFPIDQLERIEAKLAEQDAAGNVQRH